MRFPYPEYISLKHAVLFASALFCGQLLVGTTLYFASCVFAYILVATLAFNIGGGLYRASGAFVFFNAVLGLILPQCAKVFLWEPAQSNLHVPNLTITVYLVGEIGILLAVLFAKRVIPQKALISGAGDLAKMEQMAWGAFIVGGAIFLLPEQTQSGSILSFVHQLGYFLPLSTILAVFYEIKISQGRRSINAVALMSATVSFLLGIVIASRQAIFTPLVSYVLVCGALKFRFKIYHLAAIAILGFISVAYLNPYALAARNYRASPDLLNIEMDLLLHPARVQQESKTDVVFDSATHGSYYNSDTGFLDRLTLLPINALLIEHADAGYTPGWFPIIASFENLIPHFIWPNKPNINFGNAYAHEIGMLSANDFTTGISFGIFSEAYAIARWFGLLVAIPILVGMVFIVMETLIEDVHHEPWAILIVLYFAHAASDAISSQMPYIATMFTLVIVIVIQATRTLLVPVGALFTVRSGRHMLRAGPQAR